LQVSRVKKVEVIAFLIAAAFLVLLGRLYRIQQVLADHYKAIADRQHRRVEVVSPVRGVIFTADGERLATSIKVNSVFADSRFVEDVDQTVSQLAPVLRLSKQETNQIRERLLNGSRFLWVKRKISQTEKRILLNLEIPGVYFEEEFKRYYPGRRIACHVLGFCDIDDHGLEGVELIYDSLLYGQEGKCECERDALGRRITRPGMLEIPAKDGLDIYLTLDSVIQHIVETEVDTIIREFNPVSVSAIVIDPQSGEILAIANRPSFDPNSAANYRQDLRRNRAITDMYEPGSTFKPFTFAALFENNLVSLQETIFCGNGAAAFGRRTLRDHVPHGELSVLDVIAKSSNIGTAKCAQRIQPEKLDSCLRRFGFSSPTGVDLPGEARGSLAPVGSWSKYTLTSLAIGQEINVTPLQMVCAFAAIGNGGTLYKPTILKRVVDKDGNTARTAQSVAIRKVIPDQTAATLKQALVKVVEDGTGTSAKSKFYSIAGKTGTAQKTLPGQRGYAQGKFVASFVAFAPAESPRIAVIIVVNEPRGRSYFGGTVAAPAAGRIIEKSLNYLRVPPDKETKDENANSRTEVFQNTGA
jgi:cell division protein FtsI (penicillin-binding protein 3)